MLPCLRLASTARTSKTKKVINQDFCRNEDRNPGIIQRRDVCVLSASRTEGGGDIKILAETGQPTWRWGRKLALQEGFVTTSLQHSETTSLPQTITKPRFYLGEERGELNSGATQSQKILSCNLALTIPTQCLKKYKSLCSRGNL